MHDQPSRQSRRRLHSTYPFRRREGSREAESVTDRRSLLAAAEIFIFQRQRWAHLQEAEAYFIIPWILVVLGMLLSEQCKEVDT